MIGKFKFVLTHPTRTTPEVIWAKTGGDAIIEYNKRHPECSINVTVTTNKEWLKQHRVSKRKPKTTTNTPAPADKVVHTAPAAVIDESLL